MKKCIKKVMRGLRKKDSSPLPILAEKAYQMKKRVLIICFIGTRFHYLLTRFICVTRFSIKHQSFLLTRFLSLLTKFTFMLTRYLTMLTRYAKLVYKFYFTRTVDFLYFFTHATSNEYMRLNYNFFYYKNYMVE